MDSNWGQPHLMFDCSCKHRYIYALVQLQIVAMTELIGVHSDCVYVQCVIFSWFDQKSMQTIWMASLLTSRKCTQLSLLFGTEARHDGHFFVLASLIYSLTYINRGFVLVHGLALCTPFNRVHYLYIHTIIKKDTSAVCSIIPSKLETCKLCGVVRRARKALSAMLLS